MHIYKCSTLTYLRKFRLNCNPTCRAPALQGATSPSCDSPRCKGVQCAPPSQQDPALQVQLLTPKLGALGAARRGPPAPQPAGPRLAPLFHFCACSASQSRAMLQELVPSRESHCSGVAGTTLRSGSTHPPRQLMLQRCCAGTFRLFPSLKLFWVSKASGEAAAMSITYPLQ